MDMTPLQVSYWRGKFLQQTQSGTPSAIHDGAVGGGVGVGGGGGGWGGWGGGGGGGVGGGGGGGGGGGSDI